MAEVNPIRIQRFGWTPDLPDHRDLQFTSEKVSYPIHTVTLFDKHNTPPVYDQGNLGSCTGNGLAALVQFQLMNKSEVPNPSADLFYPSRLFIYYYERVIEHSVPYDSGASIRDGVKVLARKGVPSEVIWPYDISKFTDKPSKEAQKQAKKFQALEYRRVDNTDKGLLVAALDKGLPIVFGFTVYESFMTVGSDGKVPMPSRDERIIGGHCVVIWGYNAEEDYFIVRNSWGKDWGINGYFHMPSAYIMDPNLANDFWVISKTEFGD